MHLNIYSIDFFSVCLSVCLYKRSGFSGSDLLCEAATTFQSKCDAWGRKSFYAVYRDFKELKLLYNTLAAFHFGFWKVKTIKGFDLDIGIMYSSLNLGKFCNYSGLIVFSYKSKVQENPLVISSFLERGHTILRLEDTPFELSSSVNLKK